MQVAPEVGVVVVSGVGVVVAAEASGVGVVAVVVASGVGVAAVVTSGVGVVAGGEDSEVGVEKSLRLRHTYTIIRFSFALAKKN